VSLDTEEARPRPGRRPLTVTAFALAVLALASFTNTPGNETMSLVNGSGAGVYPIINYEYAIVSVSQAGTTTAQDLRAFLNWAISTGTAQLAQVNFQPLPPSVVTLSQAQIAKIKG
jgi:phosphate transport system substrate-binding protein